MTFPPPTDKQARVIWTAVTGLAIAVLVALGVAVIWGLGQALNLLAPVVWPLAIAGVLAYLLDPVVDLLQRRGLPRARAILAVFALALVIVAAVVGSVAPQIVNEAEDLVERVPVYVARMQQRLDDWVNNPPALVRKLIGQRTAPVTGTNVLSDTNAAAPPGATTAPPPAPADTNTVSLVSMVFGEEALQAASGWAAKALPKIGKWLANQAGRVAGWVGFLAGLALIPVYAFYFLLEKQGIQSRWTEYLPVAKSEFKDELVFCLRAINNYLIVFFRGQVLVAMCDGLLYTTGFLVIGLPYAVLLGAMATVLTMIPFLGAITTCLMALVLAFVQFGDWKHPALVLVVFGVVQALEGLVISPKIMGDRVGLHPLTIIVAVMVGTTVLGGILGGILAIPLTAALRVLMFRYVWKKREA
jgi:predicted PurR-regulated permease PerM